MTHALASTLTAALFLTLTACGAEGRIDTSSTEPERIAFFTDRPVMRVGVRERVVVSFQGFSPRSEVTVTATMEDGSVSHATFIADENGRFDTATFAPVRGSYQGVDADGLFWSMRADQPNMVTEGSLHVDIEASVGGEVIAHARLMRFADLDNAAPTDEQPENPCGTTPPRPPSGGSEVSR